MGQIGNPEPVRIGLVVGEPIRMEGITSVFEEISGLGHAALVPVFGAMDELLSSLELGWHFDSMGQLDHRSGRSSFGRPNFRAGSR